MKLQVDTGAKTIKIEGQVQFKDLIKTLKKLLPNDWMEYSLDSVSIIRWYNPIIWYPSYQPWTPWTWPNPAITGSTYDATTVTNQTDSVYNIEVMN